MSYVSQMIQSFCRVITQLCAVVPSPAAKVIGCVTVSGKGKLFVAYLFYVVEEFGTPFLMLNLTLSSNYMVIIAIIVVTLWRGIRHYQSESDS